MPKLGRDHGTRSCWQGGCRRPECTQAQHDYQNAWSLLDRRIRGIEGHGEVPPTDAAQHIKELLSEGMSYRAIGAASGLQPRKLWEIAHGKRPRGIKVETERRILAVTLRPVKVPALGSIRRIQALAALGHTTAEITAVAGVGPRILASLSRQATMYRATAEAIDRAYRALSMTQGPSEIGRKRALSKGWAPPLAWDDEALDDPDGKPDRGALVRGFDLDEWWYLVENGEDPAKAADRCGVTLNAVSKAAYRAGRNDLGNYAESARKRWSAAS